MNPTDYQYLNSSITQTQHDSISHLYNEYSQCLWRIPTASVSLEKELVYWLVCNKSNERRVKCLDLFHELATDSSMLRLFQVFIDVILEFMGDMCPSMIRYFFQQWLSVANLIQQDDAMDHVRNVLYKILLFMLFTKKHASYVRKRFLAYSMDTSLFQNVSIKKQAAIEFFQEKSLALTEYNSNNSYQFTASYIGQISNLDLVLYVNQVLDRFLLRYSPYLKDLVSVMMTWTMNKNSNLSILWSLYVYWNDKTKKLQFEEDETALFNFLGRIDHNGAFDANQLQSLIDNVTFHGETEEEYVEEKPDACDDFFEHFDTLMSLFHLNDSNQVFWKKTRIHHGGLQAHLCREKEWSKFNL